MTQLTPFQADLRERLLAAARDAGVAATEKTRRTRRDEPDGAGEAVEICLVLTLRLGAGRFEVWLYPGAAGVLEPGDDWWPFDAEDFGDEAELAAAVAAHVRDVLDEHAPQTLKR